MCTTCDIEVAVRICAACDDLQQCNSCFAELHHRGNRKRHAYMKIVYEGVPPVRGSINERDMSFDGTISPILSNNGKLGNRFGTPDDLIRGSLESDLSREISKKSVRFAWFNYFINWKTLNYLSA